MRSVRLRFRTELRSRWRAWVAIAVLGGVFYGSVVAAAAGGQRTNSVVARARNSSFAPDVFMVPSYSINGELLRYDAIARFPEVRRAFRMPLFPNREDYEVNGLGGPEVLGSLGRLLAGRLPDPRRPDEAIANFVAREERHLDLGDVVNLHLAGPGFTGDGAPPPGPNQRVRIVGIVASLGDFASVAGPGLSVTPAFVDRFADTSAHNDLFMFVLRRHEDDLPAFRRHMSELTGGKPIFFVEAKNDYVQVQRSFHVQAVALWVLAAFLGLVTLLVFTQALARLTWSESADNPTLSAIGMTRLQRLGLAALRGLFIGGLGALVASVLSVAVSGLMPFGRPRMAEPSPGLSAPAGFMIGGFVVTFSVLLLQSTIPAAVRRRAVATRPSRIADVATRVRGAPASIGVRLALEPGRGADSVPVRSALAATTLGVVAVVMSLTVSASLTQLLTTPRLYGWGWDAAVELQQAPADARTALETLPGVAAVGYGNLGAQVSIGSATAELVSMETGPIEPVLLDGRRPERSDEVAPARKTLRAAHAHIGSWISVAVQGQGRARRMRVTGVAVLPVESDTSTLGEGALVSGAGLRAFVPDVKPDVAFIRYSAGADHAGVLHAIGAVVGDPHLVTEPTAPSSVVDFGRVRSLPLVLAGLLAGLCLGTIAHLLVSSTHRHRHDLGVLRAMGFVARQVRAVVVWQAVALAVLSSVVGLPVGVAFGRTVWTMFAHDAGFVGQPVTRLLPLAGVGAGIIVLAVLVAAQVGRPASRSRAAVVLRAE
jgi:hypothetical protein